MLDDVVAAFAFVAGPEGQDVEAAVTEGGVPADLRCDEIATRPQAVKCGERVCPPSIGESQRCAKQVAQRLHLAAAVSAATTAQRWGEAPADNDHPARQLHDAEVFNHKLEPVGVQLDGGVLANDMGQQAELAGDARPVR